MGETDFNDGRKEGFTSEATPPSRPAAISPHDETVVSSPDARPLSAVATVPRDLSGTTFADYRLDRKIAEGGMGEVYEATQLKLDRKVAIKLLTDRLSTRPEFLHRFEREAKSAAALNHPNVVQVYDFGKDKGQYYLVMELVEGEDLSEYMQSHGKLDLVDALTVVEQAAGALKAAREKSIIHRDIKPANLMRTRSGDIKVSDLGLAKNLSEDTDVTATGVGIGSPHFLAPEQADDARHVDHRADIYSLGITLLFLLTGKRPYEGTSAFSVVMAHASKPLPSGHELGTDLPENVEALIHRMSAKRPEDRYQDYEALLDDIVLVKAGYAPAMKLRGPSGGIWRSTGAKIATAAVCAVVGTYLFIAVTKPTPSPDSLAVVAPPPVGPGIPDEPPGPGPDFGPPGRAGVLPKSPGRTALQRPGMSVSRSGRFQLPMRGPPGFMTFKGQTAKEMMAEVDSYAKANPDKYIPIISAYQKVMDKAAGTPLLSKAHLKQGNAVANHQFAYYEAIEKFTKEMVTLLEQKKPQDAWDVWKKFPANLRNPEVDQEIYQVIERWMPSEFTPAPSQTP